MIHYGHGRMFQILLGILLFILFFEKNRLTFKCFSDTDDSPLLQFPHLITTLIGLIAARGGVEDVKSFVCNVFKNELF